MDVREAAFFLQSGDERKMAVVEVLFGCVYMLSKNKTKPKERFAVRGRETCGSGGLSLRICEGVRV